MRVTDRLIQTVATQAEEIGKLKMLLVDSDRRLAEMHAARDAAPPQWTVWVSEIAAKRISGETISAIKRFRELTGSDLKTAKDFIEQNWPRIAQ